MILLRFLDARLGGRLLNQLALEPRTVPAPLTFFAYAFMHLDRQHSIWQFALLFALWLADSVSGHPQFYAGHIVDHFLDGARRLVVWHQRAPGRWVPAVSTWATWAT